MEDVITQDQQALLAQLAQAREKLEGLVRDLRMIDAQLDGLATERRQHGLVHDVCGGLEELGEIGGAKLFWGDRAAVGASAEHIRSARSRVDAFQKRVDEIELRRNALLEEIRQQQDHAEFVEDDVFEAQEEEEQRNQEWVIEREMSDPPARESIMLWARGVEDDRRFRKSLGTALLVSLLFTLIVPLIDLPLPTPGDVTIDVPERVVRMMMEERPRPPPPPREETRPQPQERLVEQKPVEKPVPQPSVKPDQEEPERVAAVTPPKVPEPEKGILAFREKVAAFMEARTSARLGLQARISSSADNSSGRPQRAMLTTNAPGSSGGINLASLSRGLGGRGAGDGSGGMAGVQVVRAASSIGGSGGGDDRPLARGGPGLSRTDEEIQIVFDRYKAAFYRLYNRELRKDATLRGQMILRLTIEPDGSVSMCMLQSSDMNAPELSAQVVDRVRTINFGAKDDVQALTIVYPIDFLPAV